LITCVTYSDKGCAWVWVACATHIQTHTVPYI
jgi:hypothetical protein